MLKKNPVYVLPIDKYICLPRMNENLDFCSLMHLILGVRIVKRVKTQKNCDWRGTEKTQRKITESPVAIWPSLGWFYLNYSNAT